MTQIYVGNLTYSTVESEIRSMFERYGRVASIRLAADSSTGRARGFAFVTMSRMEDAEEAITRLNGINLAGRSLVVNEARSDPTRPQMSAARVNALARLNQM
jgi:cold-inducible RNA-binding protein